MTRRIEIDGLRIYVLHILAELDPQAADKRRRGDLWSFAPAQDRDKERVPGRAASAYPSLSAA
jgi:hypothetical protein